MIDPVELRKKLESDGLVNVKTKLSLGAYGEKKIPFVKLWIEEQEKSAPNTENQVNKNTKLMAAIGAFWMNHWKWIIGSVLVPILIALYLM